MIRITRQFPFTFVLLCILIGVAIWTRTHIGPLAPSVRRSSGFAPLHLPGGEWARLLSCVFFTIGGLNFYASVAMAALGVGAAEWFFGTWPAIGMFWGIHLATLLIASFALALPLHALEIYPGTLLASARDVGPSAGYYGCAGAACFMIPERWRMVVIGFVLTVLALRLAWSFITIPDHGRAMSADLAHMIAFPTGIAVAILLASRAISQPI